MICHVSAFLALALALFGARPAIALVSDIPGILVPVIAPVIDAPLSVADFAKRRPSDFVHPGMWHTHEDLEAILNNALSGVEPWASAYDMFRVDTYSLANYTMQGPDAVISRGHISNYTHFSADARAAWQNALMWYITKEDAHWTRSTTILDAWGSNLTDIIGIDRSLMIGLDGDIFVNAAEIMKYEGNWTEAGAIWSGGSGFSNQLYWLFSRQAVVVGQANYGIVSIKSLMNLAVYLDDVSLWNYAVSEFINDPCASLFANFEPTTGQSSEAGRDQGHTQSGIAWAGMAMRTGQSQGFDMYSWGDNLLLKASEYAAKFNQNGSVVYDPKWFRCEAILVDGPWADISLEDFGLVNGVYADMAQDLLYYQYVVNRGLSAPWTTKAKQAEGFEGARSLNLNDLPSWGDLIWAYGRGGNGTTGYGNGTKA